MGNELDTTSSQPDQNEILMLYFAYGSNMSLARIQARTPSATPLGCYYLTQHDLRFHKASKDGSGKCDAYFTGEDTHIIYGALFKLNPNEKPLLDKAEGLGVGYDEKTVEVFTQNGDTVTAFTYFATRIDSTLSPYSWYLNHVLIGANETLLPNHYIESKIRSVQCLNDQDKQREHRERKIHL